MRVTADGAVIAVQKGQARRGWNKAIWPEPKDSGHRSAQAFTAGGAKPSQLYRLSHEAASSRKRVALGRVY